MNRFLKRKFDILESRQDSDDVVFDKRFFNYIDANQDEDKAAKIIDYISLYLARRGAISASIKVRSNDYLVAYKRSYV